MFSQTFAKVESQRKVLQDPIVETHWIFYGENVLWEEKKRTFLINFTNEKVNAVVLFLHLNIKEKIWDRLISYTVNAFEFLKGGFVCVRSLW